MVITLELYKEIRKKRLNGMSQRQIAAALHISRNTVKNIGMEKTCRGSGKAIPGKLRY